jgi:integrase
VEQFETVVALLKVRVSEIAALQWDDFDFEKNQLSFSAA